MFDFSFGEMLIVALVALVVLGPERLPKAARFTGLWVRRARAHWFSMKAELENELAAEELKRSLQAGREAMREAESELRDNLRDGEAALRDTGETLRRDLDEARPAAAAPAPAANDLPPRHD